MCSASVCNNHTDSSACILAQQHLQKGMPVRLPFSVIRMGTHVFVHIRQNSKENKKYIYIHKKLNKYMEDGWYPT